MVASGRDTISIASSIKRVASQNVFVVQVCLQDLIFLLFCFYSKKLHLWIWVLKHKMVS